MIDTVLFDLDGTLADSFEGISNGVMYALNRLGTAVPERESLKSFVGPPLFDEFKRRFGYDDDTAREAVRLYREYYPVKGLYEQKPISGAEELLEALSKSGFKLCLATSKPREYAERIISNFGFDKYIKYTAGATLDGSISEKRDVIALALKITGASAENALMVGDRFYDVEGAHACGVLCAGVLCGFGSRGELEEHGADFIADTLIEVAKIAETINRRN